MAASTGTAATVLEFGFEASATGAAQDVEWVETGLLKECAEQVHMIVLLSFRCVCSLCP